MLGKSIAGITKNTKNTVIHKGLTNFPGQDFLTYAEWTVPSLSALTFYFLIFSVLLCFILFYENEDHIFHQIFKGIPQILRKSSQITAEIFVTTQSDYGHTSTLSWCRLRILVLGSSHGWPSAIKGRSDKAHLWLKGILFRKG